MSIPIVWRSDDFTGNKRMRIAVKPTVQELSEGPQAVSFQIANGNIRQRCTLQTGLPTKVLAQKYLLTNWLVVEKMAREALAVGIPKDRENVLSALREKPLKVYEVMKRANIPNEEACQSLLLKMRDEGLVKFDIHKGRWQIG